MNYLNINFQERYSQLNNIIFKLREQIYDLVEIPHLMSSQLDANFQKDVKIVTQSLEYIMQNQPPCFGKQAKMESETLFSQLLNLQEEFFLLEEAYYYSCYQIQNSSSPQNFKILMHEKDIILSYFQRY